ncbi:147_t:CDS:1 [Acaulospora colombiana]|uniref:147_t:CDS:1 n=1 Tax=Acaulospora colombiana TaxID=27376 RepID=A0ACA9KKY3_9GLOM|nr:147_t:CDS:1 [Acaulospora colombiana]
MPFGFPKHDGDSVASEVTDNPTFAGDPNLTSPEVLTENEDLSIPPDTADHYDVKVKWRRQDEEPVLYRDRFIAVTRTYLYIFNYYMPDGKDKAISMNNITDVQTDQEVRVSYQKW